LRHFARWALAEAALSVLLAPTLMVHQVRAVLRTLAGVNGGWAPHSATRPGLAALVRFHGVETALGLGLLTLAARGDLTPWLWPIGISLSLAIPVSWLVQREMRPADAALSLAAARP
jgi:membrane glycosyltransferase